MEDNIKIIIDFCDIDSYEKIASYLLKILLNLTHLLDKQRKDKEINNIDMLNYIKYFEIITTTTRKILTPNFLCFVMENNQK
jgi:hypothetical protein